MDPPVLSEQPGDADGEGLAVLLEQLADSVAIIDRHGRILMTNRAYGFPAELSSVAMTDLGEHFPIFRPDGRAYDTAEWPVLRALETGEVILDEEFFRLEDDGSRRSFRCSSAPFHDRRGRIAGAVVVARDVTEEKRSEEQLAYLLPLLDHSEDAIIAGDAESRVIAWNHGAERLYGWSTEEAAGKALTLMWTDWNEEQHGKRQRALSEHGKWRGESTARRKDGSTLPIEAITVAIHGSGGEIRGYLAIHRDITERKRADERLRAAGQRSEQILESIGDAFFAVDRNWRYTYLNRHAVAQVANALGREFSAGELLGRSCWETFPEWVESGLHEAYREALRNPGPAELEVYVERTRGWFSARLYPSPTGISTYLHDITERKRAEERLRYHVSLLDNVEDGVIATDAEDFRITAWNRGAERLYGLSAHEVIGRPARDVASYPADQARLTLEADLLDTGRTRIEFGALRKDGSRVEVELIAVAVKDEDGKTVGYLGIHRDITDRKRSEGQLAYHASLLENMADAVLATDPGFVLTAWNRGAERMLGWSAAEALGRRVYELIPTSLSDAERARMLSELPRTGRWRGVLTWYGKGDKPVDAEGLTVATRSDDGRVSGYVCIVRDVSELRRATARLETAAREQSLLAELSLRALGTGRLQTLLADAVAVVADMLRVDLSAIWEIEPNGEQLSRRAAFGWSRDAVDGVPTIPTGTASFAGYTAMVGEPVVSEDLRTDGRFELSPLFRAEAPVSAVAVVIPGPRRPFGVLAAATRVQRSFEPTEVKFVEAAATLIGIAIERTQEGERLEAAREAERTRIARELHDDGLRELTEALGAASIARSTATDERDEQRWVAMTVSLQRLGQQLRSAIYNLRLGTHEERAFVDLLDELVAVQTELAANCHVVLTGRDGLPPGSLGRRGTELLRIVREAITNARRHADTTLIRVEADGSTRERLRIAVTDDGRWPDRERVVANRGGTGILGMFERAEEIGATLGIQGSATGGTTVSLELPLRARSGGGPLSKPSS